MHMSDAHPRHSPRRIAPSQGPIRRRRSASSAVARSMQGQILRSQQIEVISRLQHQLEREAAIRRDLEQRLASAKHDLGERVKELNCLYRVAELMEQPELSLEQVLEGIVEVIPQSWQYPAITCARLVADDMVCATKNYRPAAWQQTSDIMVFSRRAGIVEVGYLEPRPTLSEGPFLAEERSLINAIAERVGRYIERIRTERSLRESEEQYRMLADFPYDWEYWIGPDGTYVYVSPSCRRITGYAPEVFLRDPHHFMAIIHEADRGMVGRSHGATHLNDTDVCSIEFRIITADGRQRWIGHNCQGVFRDDGTYLGRRGTNRDITESKQAEDKLQQQQAELAHALRVATLGELASNFAHELNQPLCTIQTFAHAAVRLMQSHQHVTDELVEAIEQMAVHADRAGGIIKHMRKLAAPQKPARSAMDLGTILKDSALLLAKLHRQDKEVVVLDVPELPQVVADTVQVEQVVVNLIKNAFEAMEHIPQDQRRLTVAARPVESDKVQVCIRDTGPGMTDEQLDAVFRPFVTTRADGLGLGLSISYTIIESNGGRLWAERNECGGMTFCFTVPTS